MATVEERLKTLEGQIQTALAVAAAMQGQPAPATISVPHNDSWLFEDNVDATHPANLRYVISANVQRVVSARLSIHLAPYRTYNTLSVSATGVNSVDHAHPMGHSHSHSHSWTLFHFGYVNAVTSDGTGNLGDNTGGADHSVPTNTDATGSSAGNTGGQSQQHTHNVSASGVLGVTEGATATGVTISFDGTDATAALGGPFNSDVIELDVLRFLVTSKNLWHTIAMQPSGLGRIEAHLRLGVYVAAGTTF